jgi:glyoxylate carboligase
VVSKLTQVGYVAGVHYPVYERQTYIGNQGTLGYGFPTSLGVAVGNPDRAVVSIRVGVPSCASFVYALAPEFHHGALMAQMPKY